MVALPVAVLDAGALLGWLGAANMQVEGDWHIASALVTEAAMSEAVHFLVTFHDGNDAALEADLVALQLAPTLTTPVLPLAVASRDALATCEEWGLATTVALARAQGLPDDYVRALAADLGSALGCGAHLASLRRTRSGPFRIDQARPLASLCESDPEAALIAPALVLGFPLVLLTALDVKRLLHGGEVEAGRRAERVGRDEWVDLASPCLLPFMDDVLAAPHAPAVEFEDSLRWRNIALTDSERPARIVAHLESGAGVPVADEFLEFAHVTCLRKPPQPWPGRSQELTPGVEFSRV